MNRQWIDPPHFTVQQFIRWHLESGLRLTLYRHLAFHGKPPCTPSTTAFTRATPFCGSSAPALWSRRHPFISSFSGRCAARQNRRGPYLICRFCLYCGRCADVPGDVSYAAPANWRQPCGPPQFQRCADADIKNTAVLWAKVLQTASLSEWPKIFIRRTEIR